MSEQTSNGRPERTSGEPQQPPTDFSYTAGGSKQAASEPSEGSGPKKKPPMAAIAAAIVLVVILGGGAWLFTAGPLSQRGARLAMGDAYSDNLSPDKYDLRTPERDVDDKHTFTFELDDSVDLGMEEVSYDPEFEEGPSSESDDSTASGDGGQEASGTSMGRAEGAVRVYADGGLSQEVPIDVIQQKDEDGNRLEVSPANVVVDDLSKENSDSDIDMFRNDQSSSDEFAFGRWYGYDGYYLVRYIGKDGKKLDKPEVTYFTVKDDVSSDADALPAPSVNFQVGDNGGLDVSWSPVEGAERYKVYLQVVDKTTEDKTRRYSYSLLAETDGDKTSINTMDYDFRYKRGVERNKDYDYYGTGADESYGQNYQFQDLLLGQNEDDIFNNRQQAAAGTQGTEVAYYVPNADHVKSCSIAVVAERGETGQSPFRFHSIQKLLGQMPVGTSYYIQGAYQKQAPDRTKDAVGYLQNRLTQYVIMADGTVKSMTRVLDFSKMVTKDVTLYEGTSEADAKPVKTTLWAVPYKLQNSMIQGTLGLDQRQWTNDSAKVQAGYDQAREQLLASGSKTGMPQRVKQDWNVDWNKVQADAKPATEIADVPYQVNGSSEYVKFVASNIIAGNMYLDITEYQDQPGAPDFSGVLVEAIDQNPMTLLSPSSAGYEMRHDGDRVVVAITDDFTEENSGANKLVEMRKTVSDTVDKLIKENFTDGMGDEEKVKKAMEVICDRIKYDKNCYAMVSGLDSMKDEDSKAVTDSFEVRGYSAYAIADDGYALCAGYAELFKLFADRLGLQCYYVSGEVPPTPGSSVNGHAWNIVKMGDAWKVVDTTWADTDAKEGAQYDGKAYTLLDFDDPSLEGRTYDIEWLANRGELGELVPEDLIS